MNKNQSHGKNTKSEIKKDTTGTTEKRHAPTKGHHLTDDDRKKGGQHSKGSNK